MLKKIVREKITQEVFQNGSKFKPRDRRVLVVDEPCLRILSACFIMHEIILQGIILVEDLKNKKRESIPAVEAVYLITPSPDSIEVLMNDFQCRGQAKYKCAHVFFTEACGDELFNKLAKHPAAKFIETLKEINMSFVPYESRVFSLDMREAFQFYYNPQKSQGRTAVIMEQIAEKIATLCETLAEYPTIRFSADYKLNAELAQLVQKKLDAYKKDEPKMGQGPGKARSQLLILDRRFDIVSLLLHELTLQAMVYDLLLIINDVYRYKSTSGGPEKEVLLDENNDLWTELRHQHIADVSRNVAEIVKKFIESKRMRATDEASIRDLAEMIKKMPEYLHEILECYTHVHLVEDCTKYHEQGKVDELCKVEQCIVMGTDASGKKIKDPIRLIGPILQNTEVSIKNKIRLILLYILSKNGISEENLTKLLELAQVPASERSIVINLAHLGLNVIAHANNKKNYQITRKERITDQQYASSRWTPVIKTIAEYAMENKLDAGHFPFLAGRPAAPASKNTAKSARFFHMRNKNKSQGNVQSVPRLIIFIVGGVSYSELRAIYEAANACQGWDILVGSTHIMTPESFLEDLKELSNAN